jgi:hypothetical protein
MKGFLVGMMLCSLAPSAFATGKSAARKFQANHPQVASRFERLVTVENFKRGGGNVRGLKKTGGVEQLRINASGDVTAKHSLQAPSQGGGKATIAPDFTLPAMTERGNLRHATSPDKTRTRIEVLSTTGKIERSLKDAALTRFFDSIDPGGNDRVEPATPEATVVPKHDAVATRAFELFEQRGRTHGFDRQDWFQAEQELKGAR